MCGGWISERCRPTQSEIEREKRSGDRAIRISCRTYYRARWDIWATCGCALSCWSYLSLKSQREDIRTKLNDVLNVWTGSQYPFHKNPTWPIVVANTSSLYYSVKLSRTSALLAKYALQVGYIRQLLIECSSLWKKKSLTVCVSCIPDIKDHFLVK